MALVATIFMTLAYGSMSIFWRLWGKRDISPFAIQAASAFIAPVFLIFGTFKLATAPFINTPEYWGFLLSWQFLNLLNVYGLIWLYKFIPLTQSKAIKSAMMILISLLIGIYLGETSGTYLSIFASCILAFSAFLLTPNDEQSYNKKAFLKIALFMAVLGFLDIVKLHFYQKALWIQEDIWVHQSIALLVGIPITVALGAKSLKLAWSKQKLTAKEIFIFNALALTGMILEVIALNTLSISDFILITVPLGILYIYVDVKQRDLIFTHKSIFALSLLAFGLLLMMIDKS